MYIKPTKEQIEIAIEDGWDKEVAERGYDIFDCGGTGLLAIERLDIIYACSEYEVTDEDCAREAEQTGFCKIIPINELPREFDDKYYVWIDTPENREAIRKYCER